jgi:hypothetical protein
MLAQTGSKVVGGGRPCVDLDETGDVRYLPKQAHSHSFGLVRGVGLVAEVGVLGLRRYFVLGDGAPTGAEGFLADLLAELVEMVAHGTVKRTRRAVDGGLSFLTVLLGVRVPDTRAGVLDRSEWAKEVAERIGAVARGEANPGDAAQALADAMCRVQDAAKEMWRQQVAD